MTRPIPVLQREATGIAIVLSLVVTPALPQSADQSAQRAEEKPASTAYLDFSTGVRATDNYEYLEKPKGSTYLSSTDLVLGYDSETKYQSLTSAIGATFEFGDYAENPDQHADIQDPFVRLNYNREANGSIFNTSFIYLERDNGIDLYLDPITSSDLIVDRGTRSDLRFGARYATGLDGPTRFDTRVNYDRRRVFDTTNPELTDRDIFSASAELGLGVTRSAELLLIADYYNRDEFGDESTDEVQTAIGIGVAADINPVLSFRGVLKNATNEWTDSVNGDSTTTIENRPTIDLKLVQDRPNGTIEYSAYSRLNNTGVLSTAEVRRAMELKRGALAFSVGATRTEAGNVNPVGGLQWRRDYKSSALFVDFNSSLGTDDDGEDVVYSRLGMTFRQQLTSLDGFEFAVNASGAEGIEDDGTDRRQAIAGLNYFRKVNRDWEFKTGYRYSYSYENDDDNPITQNEVFATFGRRFSIRP